MVESSEDEEKPDSTQPPSNKVYGATGSNAGSGIVPCSGVLHKKKKRARINSDSQPISVKQNDTPINISEEEESESEIKNLVRTKMEMEVKLKQTQRRLMDQKMEGKMQDYQDHTISCIRDFRTTHMDCYSVPKTDERLVAG